MYKYAVVSSLYSFHYAEAASHKASSSLYHPVQVKYQKKTLYSVKLTDFSYCNNCIQHYTIIVRKCLMHQTDEPSQVNPVEYYSHPFTSVPSNPHSV